MSAGNSCAHFPHASALRVTPCESEGPRALPPLHTHWTVIAFDDLKPRELHAALRLRAAVFGVEQQCLYVDPDELDAKSSFLLGYVEERLVATARIVAPALSPYAGYACIGRVCTAIEVRARGVGRRAMHEALRHVADQFGTDVPIRIGAQVYLRAFYESFSFVVDGDDAEHDDEGVRCVYMVRRPPRIGSGSAPRLRRASSVDAAHIVHVLQSEATVAADVARDLAAGAFQCLLAVDDACGTIVGVALHHGAYSTWRGRMLFVDCVRVVATHRGRGIGKRLLRALVAEASAAGCCRVAFNIERANTQLVSACARLPGAMLLQEWVPVRLERDAVAALLAAPLSSSPNALPALRIRSATAADASHIQRLIVELAVYEREPVESVRVDEATLVRDGFASDARAFEVLLAVNDSSDCVADGGVIGMAFYFFAYDAHGGRALFLEDLVVSPAHRGRGAGMALLRALAAVATAQQCCRMQWQVLDWNAPAIKFYERIGAALQTHLLPVRFDEQGIPRFLAC